MSLPDPVTIGVLYLKAILDELRKIGDVLVVKPQSVQNEAEEVDLVELKPKCKKNPRYNKVSR